MASTDDSLGSQLRLEAFPRSSHYDLKWMLETEMGPNVVWLTEALSQVGSIGFNGNRYSLNRVYVEIVRNIAVRRKCFR